MVRKQPETFCLTFGMRTACSARLLVNGTLASVMKRHTSSLYWRRRQIRLVALLCLGLPRLPVDSAMGLAAKSGKKMPGVKLLHQQSDSNTKPQYIMGHSMQAVSMLVRAAQSVLAVPLAVRIHEGLVWSNRDRRTLLDKMIALLGIVSVKEPFYFVADAYYAARKIATSAGSPQKGSRLQAGPNKACSTAASSNSPRTARPSTLP